MKFSGTKSLKEAIDSSYAAREIGGDILARNCISLHYIPQLNKKKKMDKTFLIIIRGLKTLLAKRYHKIKSLIIFHHSKFARNKNNSVLTILTHPSPTQQVSLALSLRKHFCLVKIFHDIKSFFTIIIYVNFISQSIFTINTLIVLKS